MNPIEDIPWLNWSNIESANFEISVSSDEIYHDVNKKAVLFTTSGSTGNPKIVMLSHDNITFNAIAHAKSVEFTLKDVFLVTMPIHFSSTITTQILSCIFLKTKMHLVTLPLLPRTLFKILRNSEITCLSGVPTMINILIREANESNNIYNNIRTFVVSGSPLYTELLSRARVFFPKADFLQDLWFNRGFPTGEYIEERSQKK